ncbi:hypothetical protein PUMCH_003067 [Australozyma saopauloensis]|uniref:Early meiotic induction protein 1 n=1 Tax=Australozyma saopauloensis TaxID=291208 RepID=A0AAX4HDG0_9ASCO|nr:hypothetical protein PUMCH_003067 [[Candida] saopauloensis]
MKDSQIEGLDDLESLFTNEELQIESRRKRAYEAVRENDISSFPSDMSIITAFDEVLACFGLGGQVRNYYRYGTYNLCEDARKKLWFAVKNGSMSEKRMDAEKMAKDSKEMERRAKVQQYYKDKLMRDKLAGSSEDVWEERKSLLTRPFRE